MSFPQAVEAFRRGELDLAHKLANESAAEAATPQWHHLVGLIYCRQGTHHRGVEHLRLAADAEPHNLAFKVMLARALIDAGNPEEVLRMVMPSPTTAAGLALWHTQAEAAGGAGDDVRAVHAWQTIADCAPGDSDAWTNLGRSLLKLRRFGEAEQAYRRALALSPESVPAVFELGLVYERTNQLDELGRLLDEALQRGIAKDQLGLPLALREHRAGNLSAARALLLGSDPNRDPAGWFRLRARIADKQGNAIEAFQASVAMNRTTPNFRQWLDRAAIYRSEVRTAAGMITAQWAKRVAPLPPGPVAPVFVVGFPRSGTTLLDTFLMGHPSIFVVEEIEMLRRAGEIAGSIDQLPNVPAEQLERARAAYVSELAERVPSDFEGCMVDKQPLNMLAAPYIHMLFPDARIIFVQRHPCDAVLSGFMQSFAPNLAMASFLELGDAADLYDAAMSLWTKAKAILPLKIHTVVYEDLILDPESQLRAVMDFLGLDWNAGLIDHRATAKARGAIMNTSYDQVTEKLNSAASGRWRRYEQQLRPVLPILLPWAEKLGYATRQEESSR